MLWNLATDAPWPWQPTGQPADVSHGWVSGSVAVSNTGLLALGVGPFSGGSSTVDVWDAVAGVRIGEPIQVPGLVDALAFSPDGATLALSVVSTDKQTLGLELVDPRTLTVGPRLVAHPGSTDGAFDHGDQPFRSILIFSPDGRTVSSVVSRSTVGAVATFDTSTGALISHPDVGRDRTVLDVSSGLGYLVLGAGATDSATTQSPVEVVDAGTGEVIVDFKVPSAPLLARPVTMNPARHELVFQNGVGALVSLDWSQAGAPSFATAGDAQLYGPTVAIDSDGTVVDLSEPVQLLGLGESVTPFRQWKASTDGQVVFITGETAQIWDPSEHRFVRRLTGVPPSCATSTRMTFVGSAEHGRIILACTPTMVSWNLDAASEAPQWQTDRSDPMDVVVGPTLNHSRSMFVDHDTIFLRLVEAATGRVISRVARTPDQVTALAFSPDDSMVAAVYWSGDIDLLDASDLSPIRTLKSRTGSVVDGGVDGGFPAVTITADNTYVAAWHRKLGLEIWDAASGESLAVIDGRRDYRPSASGDRESTIPIAGFGDVAFPTVTVWSSDDGSVLHAQVVQAFVRTDGTGVQRSLGTEWSMNVDNWVKAACGIVGRDLTQEEWETYIGAGVPYHATCTT
jgi:WD40 repeat protein